MINIMNMKSMEKQVLRRILKIYPRRTIYGYSVNIMRIRAQDDIRNIVRLCRRSSNLSGTM